ncbi:class I SAM-dependent methyltransferase [Lentibacillus daqui]|uniref:class I SAM-dependent methyltransferase n=1 Tax=Lentibacillus daqui TaxID=2911514 RepID=UPI0022B1D3F1|nr:class I SAM-dependent methyltransferase [Lentibacillus daqui]
MSKEHWDNSFSDTDYVYGETANVFIQDKSNIIPEHAKIGCFAEGEGRNAVYLATLGHDVTAFDQSEVGLDKTNALAAKNNVDVKTVALDLTKEKVLENQFDTGIMVFGHVPKSDQSFFINSLISSVKPGGYVMFEVYSEEQLEYGTGGPPAKEMLYDPKDLLKWISDYKVLHFYYGEAERHEGKKHSGDCHVIQVVLQK